MGTVLRHVLLLQKDITKAARFYNEGLELPILALTDRWAELGAGSSRIALKAVEGYFLAVHLLLFGLPFKVHPGGLRLLCGRALAYCDGVCVCTGRPMPTAATHLSSLLRLRTYKARFRNCWSWVLCLMGPSSILIGAR